MVTLRESSFLLVICSFLMEVTLLLINVQIVPLSIWGWAKSVCGFFLSNFRLKILKRSIGRGTLVQSRPRVESF